MVDVPEMPEGFQELCENIGLAILQGQKVQFALAHYYAFFGMVNQNWTKDQAKQSIDNHLSRPMGIVIGDIENNTDLNHELLQAIKDFREVRNWLVHDFDEESTRFISNGAKVDHYLTKMREIQSHAFDIQVALDEIGQKMNPASQVTG